jgi:hypothetical protein
MQPVNFATARKVSLLRNIIAPYLDDANKLQEKLFTEKGESITVEGEKRLQLSKEAIVEVKSEIDSYLQEEVSVDLDLFLNNLDYKDTKISADDYESISALSK